MTRQRMGVKTGLIILAAASASLPVRVERNFDFRHLSNFSRLPITIERNSPPISALEDITIPAIKEPQRIRLQPAEEKSGPRVINLDSMTISKSEIPREEPKELVSRISPAPAPASVTVPEVSVREPIPESVPAPVAIRWNENRAGAVPSEIVSAKIPNIEREPQTESKTVWLAGATQNASQRTFKDPLVIPQGGERPGITTSKPDIEKMLASFWKSREALQGATSVASVGTASAPEASSWSGEISGPIELRGGLAYLGGNTKLSVFRYRQGQNFEFGKVDYSKGTFSIKLAGLTGVLKAELRDNDGTLLGRGEIWLEDIKTPGSATKVVVTPTETTGIGKVASLYKSALKQPVIEIAGINHNFAPDPKGQFSIPATDSESSFVERATADGHWPTMTLASANAKSEVQLYPDSMIVALWEAVGRDLRVTRAELENHGLVWGKVLQNGIPVEGAEVELTDSESVGPIYFNEANLPDLSMKATGKDGSFVFVKVAPGISFVRAGRDGRFMPSKIIPVDRRTVTALTFETKVKMGADVFVYNPVTLEPVRAQVNFVGSEKVATANMGFLKVRYTDGQEPLFVEALPIGANIPIRFAAPRGRRAIDIPAYSDKWIEGIEQETHTNRLPTAGTIIGKIAGRAFQVYLDESDSTTEVFYFDDQGRLVSRPTQGGGFIIFNCPAGLRTITVAPEGGGAILTRALAVDDQAISVFEHRF